MKTTVIGVVVLTWLGSHVPARADDFKEKIVREFSLSGTPGASTLAVFNINGSIRVEGYAGDKVLLEVQKTLSADNRETLEKGKREFKLRFEQTGDSVLVYIGEPFCSFNVRNGSPNGGSRNGGPGNRRERCPDQDGGNHRRGYEYRLDFTIRIPYATNLYASTVNGGDVVVKNVAGSLRAFNVNGPVTLQNAEGATEVSTVNGNVEASYAAVPDGATYYTLNGDINVRYPADLSADLQFKNNNGEFYTDFSDAEALPPRVTKNREGRGGGTVYTISQASSVRVGKGGKTYQFETFNGNIYVKRQ